jgi:Na+-transporting NADH:ubiquinone oxidoreductase subunit NqrD
MNKKTTITLVILLAVLIISAVFYFIVKNKKPSEISTTMISGVVQTTSTGTVTVTGDVRSNSGLHQESKTIEFVVDSHTIIKNTVVMSTAEQLASKKPFTPKTEVKNGSLSDLKHDFVISKIQSVEDLFSSNKATAVEIDYITYVYPQN